MEREVSPGYVPWGKQGTKLVDPERCPDGHPWATDGTWQRGYEHCSDHRGHPSWRCPCGRWMYLREDGTIVEQLGCQRPLA